MMTALYYEDCHGKSIFKRLEDFLLSLFVHVHTIKCFSSLFLTRAEINPLETVDLIPEHNPHLKAEKSY